MGDIFQGPALSFHGGFEESTVGPQPLHSKHFYLLSHLARLTEATSHSQSLCVCFSAIPVISIVQNMHTFPRD